MRSTRNQIIATTCDLLESQGFHGTGLNQIVQESGTPKGSLYYYFPEGKDELAEAAIASAGQEVAERIRIGLSEHADAAVAVRNFVLNVAHHVEASGFRSGGPLTIVTMETATTNERLNMACRDAYRQLQGAFEAKLAESGYGASKARELATFITATIEGGILLCRTYHSGDPLRVIAEQLEHLLRIAQAQEHG